MAGLLDSLNSDEGLLGLLLMQAGSAKPVRTGFGEGLLGAVQAMQQRKAQQEDRDMRKQQFGMQQQQLQLALQQAQRQAAREKTLEDLPAQFMKPGQMPPSMDARDIGQPGEQQIPAQQFDMAGYSNAMFKYDPRTAMALQQSLQKDDSPISVSEGTTLLDRKTRLPIFTNPKNDQPSSVKEWQFAKTQGFPGTFEQWTREQANLKAPKTTVSVNTGQKGFDNTLKLRSDFRSEPVYKAHQEMQSAYSQIQQSLKQASPAGDLAGATKIMKLLDPGSVVRESELGMAMAASGMLDRLQYYATNVIQGTKLTPTQRKDFQNLADALYGESVKQYNAKRSEYQGIAERNQLSVPDVLGTESSMPAPAGEWSIKLKK